MYNEIVFIFQLLPNILQLNFILKLNEDTGLEIENIVEKGSPIKS